MSSCVPPGKLNFCHLIFAYTTELKTKERSYGSVRQASQGRRRHGFVCTIFGFISTGKSSVQLPYCKNTLTPKLWTELPDSIDRTFDQ